MFVAARVSPLGRRLARGTPPSALRLLNHIVVILRGVNIVRVGRLAGDDRVDNVDLLLDGVILVIRYIIRAGCLLLGSARAFFGRRFLV